MTTQTSLLNSERKLRKFSPVILFHDHQYIKAGSGDLEHIHIPYGDPRYLDVHKKRVHEMLETNGKYWLDFITYTRDHPEEHSPVPSLVSSPSPPYFDKKKTLPNNNAVSAANNKRRRGNLPKAVTAILRDWLSRHKKHPYPTEEEKAALAIETNLNLNQISNWFINARRRILQPMLEQEEEQQQQAKHHLDIIMPYDHHLQDDRRLRKRSASEILSPTKYPPQKRMSPNPAMMNRRRS